MTPATVVVVYLNINNFSCRV